MPPRIFLAKNGTKLIIRVSTLRQHPIKNYKLNWVDFIEWFLPLPPNHKTEVQFEEFCINVSWPADMFLFVYISTKIYL